MANVAGWAVLGAALGWIAAWFLRGHMAGKRLAQTHADARAKHEQLKRDLESRLGRFENDLVGAKETIYVRDAAIAERDKLMRQQTDQLAAAASQLTALSVERDDQQTRLTEQSASLSALEQDFRAAQLRVTEQETRLADNSVRLAQLEPIPAKLASTEEDLRATKGRLESAQALVNSQDQEISRLHKRAVELEPLTVQVKERQARLQEMELRLADAVRRRDGEIAQWKKQAAELESLPGRIADAEAKRARLAEEMTSLRRAKDQEIESLQDELRAIERLKRELAARDNLFLSARENEIVARRDSDLAAAALKAERAQRDSALDAKDSAIGRMYQQLAELAPLPEAIASHSARALELERGLLQRDRKLRDALHETDLQRARVLEWMRVGGALPARDAEIARLRSRLPASD
jgi:chromosome segregation ATPase